MEHYNFNLKFKFSEKVSIAMGADYLIEVNDIDIWAPTFFNHKYLFVATVVSGNIRQIFVAFSENPNFNQTCRLESFNW